MAVSPLSEGLHQLLSFLLQDCGVLTGGAERGKQADDKIWSWLLLLVQSRTKILGYDTVSSGSLAWNSLLTTTTFLVLTIERLDDCNQMYLQRMYMINVNKSLELLDKWLDKTWFRKYISHRGVNYHFSSIFFTQKFGVFLLPII